MAVNKWIGGTYYVGADGVMLTNTTTPNGVYYYVNGMQDSKVKATFYK